MSGSKSKTRLRDFQAALAERLQQATRTPEHRSRLAVVAGRFHLLLRLDEVGEVAPVPAITRVPRTQPWFSGVANVRGALYAVTDLARWLGDPPTRLDAEARLVLLGGVLMRQRTALVVTRVLGLRQLDKLIPMTAASETWSTGRWQDDQGLLWTEMDFHRLLGDPEFLQIAA